jgi:hypothetical protein
MRGLSSNEFVLGFRTTQRPINATVRVALDNGRGKTVIAEESPLVDWVWSYSVASEPRDYFVYRAGKEQEVPIGGGSVRLERLGVRADGGWGSYFHPVPSESYTLRLDVAQPAAAPTDLRVVVQCAEVYSP